VSVPGVVALPDAVVLDVVGDIVVSVPLSDPVSSVPGSFPGSKQAPVDAMSTKEAKRWRMRRG
jgi:hypothetical protein